ncbi:IreB family regulatory phosphoprotein [Pasteuria penetrans]|uniref:IreB family regulatory phosphoprotein n=1 Tax=Pasteuria penetrans TaxID=86005 RepID=UPI000FA6DDFE|nr:IreB family regulatory phosphoprotein [Pasteuria penetrans]
MDETKRFRFFGEREVSPGEVLRHVYQVLEEDSNYDAMTQMVGYLLTGELAYIPRKNDARAWISKVERDKLLEELLQYYPGIVNTSTGLTSRKSENGSDSTKG